ncbi:MAG: hypothetical protein K2N36_08210, partial [Ruminiclostridium sp.]|nr:hypothetical protein [Ruminiclostridium sp.]
MKKSEKLSQAIGGLNEDIIEKADRRRSAEKSKKAKKFPLKLTATIAASLAAVIGITALFPRNASALALAEADYPIATKYPAEVDSNFEKWGEEIHARLERGELIPSSVNNFYKKTAEEFLSGDENRAYSPVNIYMALAMLGEATDGESRRQILDLLGASNI